MNMQIIWQRFTTASLVVPAFFLTLAAVPARAADAPVGGQTSTAAIVIGLIVQTQRCESDQPTMKVALTQAFDGWRQRNADLFRKATSDPSFNAAVTQAHQAYNQNGVKFSRDECIQLLQTLKY